MADFAIQLDPIGMLQDGFPIVLPQHRSLHWGPINFLPIRFALHLSRHDRASEPVQVDNPEVARFIGRTETLYSEENWVELVAHLLGSTDAVFEKDLGERGKLPLSDISAFRRRRPGCRKRTTELTILGR